MFSKPHYFLNYKVQITPVIKNLVMKSSRLTCYIKGMSNLPKKPLSDERIRTCVAVNNLDLNYGLIIVKNSFYEQFIADLHTPPLHTYRLKIVVAPS